jgi:hypothetical protein
MGAAAPDDQIHERLELAEVAERGRQAGVAVIEPVAGLDRDRPAELAVVLEGVGLPVVVGPDFGVDVLGELLPADAEVEVVFVARREQERVRSVQRRVPDMGVDDDADRTDPILGGVLGKRHKARLGIDRHRAIVRAARGERSVIRVAP